MLQQIAPNKPWSEWHCSTSHMVNDGRMYTVDNCGNFAELTTYSLTSHVVESRRYFFVKPIAPDNCDSKNYYWNCGTIDRAVELAKHDADARGCDSLQRSRLDLSYFYCHETSKKF